MSGVEPSAIPTSTAELIRSRRSHRHFLPDPVPADVLTELLDLTLEAPSSWNFQSRSIVVATDRDVRSGIHDATGGQPQPVEAPVVLVFLAEIDAWRHDTQDIFDTARRRGAWSDEFVASSVLSSNTFQNDLVLRGLDREYAVKDAMLAAGFCLIAAQSLGLATSAMGGWDENAVKKVIGLEGRDDVAVALLIAVGTPREERVHPGRRPHERTVHFQHYRN